MLSSSVGIQACCVQQIIVYILRLHEKGVKVADDVTELFAGELNPVAAKAQRKVRVPDGSVFILIIY